MAATVSASALRTYNTWIDQHSLTLWGDKDHLTAEQRFDVRTALVNGLEGQDVLKEYIGNIGGWVDSTTEDNLKEKEQFIQHEYEMFQEYSPKMAELTFQNYKKYQPQITGIQQGIADDLYPEIKTLRSQVGERLAEGPTKLDDVTRDFYTRSIREAQSDRGFLDSPAAGRAEAEGITNLARQQYNQDAALALSLPRVSAAGYNTTNDYYSALSAGAMGTQSTFFNQGIAQQNSDLQYQQFLENLKRDEPSENKGAGALGGAVAGAQVGTSFGPWGPAIGAVVGGIAGYAGSDIF